MPLTIKHAVQVAFDLGFRYLWVDALCLIQDLSPNEFHSLVSEIPEVYRHAALTIAAYSSRKADEGFLQLRDLKMAEHIKSFSNGNLCECCISIKGMHGSSGSAMFKCYLDKWWALYEQGPINDRGWTLQERMLSRRYLIFSNRATRWVCTESMMKNEPMVDGGDAQWVLDVKTNFHNRDKDILWRELVQAYTDRQLGNEKDRPIAISALAYEQGDPEDYAAGLWLSSITSDLCWGENGSSLRNRELYKPFRSYYAPSWSWWSTRHGVNWFMIHRVVSFRLKEDPHFRLLGYNQILDHPSAPFGKRSLITQ